MRTFAETNSKNMDINDVLTMKKDTTTYDEQKLVQDEFLKEYGFRCKSSLAHDIILTVRGMDAKHFYMVMDWYRHKRYGFAPCSK